VHSLLAGSSLQLQPAQKHERGKGRGREGRKGRGGERKKRKGEKGRGGERERKRRGGTEGKRERGGEEAEDGGWGEGRRVGRSEVKEKGYHLFNLTYLDPLGHTKSEKSLPVSVHGQGIALCLPPPVHGVQQPGCQDLGPGVMLVILPQMRCQN